MRRRLEDKIRDLCEKLIRAEDKSEEFHAAAAELRASLSEHISRLRRQVADYPIARDRRSRED